MWPLTEGAAQGTTKTVLISGLTKAKPRQLTHSNSWQLVQENEVSAV